MSLTVYLVISSMITVLCLFFATIVSWIPQYALACVREESWAPVRSNFGSIDRSGSSKMSVLREKTKCLDLYVLEDGAERVTVKPTPSLDEPKKPFGSIRERNGTVVLKGMVSLPSISYVYVYFRYLRSSAGNGTHRL